MAIVSVMFTRALMIKFLPLSNIAMHQSRLRLLYVFFAIAVRGAIEAAGLVASDLFILPTAALVLLQVT